MCNCSRAPHHRTVLQNGQDKTPKASPKKHYIMEYSPELPIDTKSMRSCSGNRAKMLIKSPLAESNATPNITGHQTPWAQFREWLRVTGETIRELVSLGFNFIIKGHTTHVCTNHAEVTVQELCYCHFYAWWGWHNSHQSGVIGITDQLILQNV